MTRWIIQMNYPDEISRWNIQMNYPDELSRWIIQINYRDKFSRWMLQIIYPDELSRWSRWVIQMNHPDELSRWIIQRDYSELFSYLILILGVRFETGVSELQISNRVENVKRKTSSNSRIFTKARVNIKLSLGQIIRDTVYFEAESQFQSQAYFKTTIQMSNAIQGEYYVFRHLKCAICE